MGRFEAPGVFVEEIALPPSIEGVPTSTTAFVGRTWRGPIDRPTLITSFAEYERAFGGLWREAPMGHAVAQFFANEGRRAIVVRVANGGSSAAFTVGSARFIASDRGSWGRNVGLTLTIDDAAPDPLRFDLAVADDPAARRDDRHIGGSGLVETFRGVSVDAADDRFVGRVLEDESRLLRLDGELDPTTPARDQFGRAGVGELVDGTGDDGGVITPADIADAGRGIHVLPTDDFDLLVIPPLAPDIDVPPATWAEAARSCQERRAIVIIDAPASWLPDGIEAELQTWDLPRENAALYYPRLLAPDPLDGGRSAPFAPGGAVAGVIARIDEERAVWKAPAGRVAGIVGATGTRVGGEPRSLTDGESRLLNPLGVSVIREMPGAGIVVWGARTLAGDDRLASEWKYLPVRRLALYLERSIDSGIQWAVFEPNAEPLWARLRQAIGDLLLRLWREGAFQGTTPRDAYFVKCDPETTTQHDIDRRVVNVLVGFAPVKPAEFVVLRFAQRAGQPDP